MNIHIIDLDNVLHIGAKAGKMSKFNTSAFPTGGIYNLLRLLKTKHIFTRPEENKAIIVYDTPNSWRRQIHPGYKAGRTKNRSEVDLIKSKAVRLQKELLIDTFKKCGFIVIGMEGMEADDLMFNAVYSIACNTNQPLHNGSKITLYSSDADWLGALGLTSNIYFESTNSNSEKISSVRYYGDYQNAFGTALEYHYIFKAIYGDTSDEYTGYRNPAVLRSEEMKGLNNSNYWNYYFWEELIKKYHSDEDEDIQKHIFTQLRLAFPIYHPDVFSVDYINKLETQQLDLKPLQERLNILRVKILEKQIGKLEDYSQEHKKKMIELKRYFEDRYKDVFNYYKTIEYIPKITAKEVDEAFSKTKINKS